MNNPEQCRECQAILEELRDTLAETQSIPAFREVRAIRDDLLELLRETEEDEERTEELIRKYRFRPQYPLQAPSTAFLKPKVRDAIRRLLEHRARTGHACSIPRLE